MLKIDFAVLCNSKVLQYKASVYSLDSKEISVEIGNWDDDSIRGVLLSSDDKELTDCKLVLESDTFRGKESQRVGKTI